MGVGNYCFDSYVQFVEIAVCTVGRCFSLLNTFEKLYDGGVISQKYFYFIDRYYENVCFFCLKLCQILKYL